MMGMLQHSDTVFLTHAIHRQETDFRGEMPLMACAKPDHLWPLVPILSKMPDNFYKIMKTMNYGVGLMNND